MTDIERDLSQVSHRPGAERPGVTEYLLAMGHELRAPLNGVIGMSGLLLDSELSAQQRQYVRSVHSAGESLGAILNDILDLARVATARLIVEPIPFDLKSMIEETASVLTPRAAERGLALRVDLRPELPRHVIGDPGRTRQVLGNLVGHAVNGTSQGEIVIRVTADGESGERAWVRFSVEDTGIGISADRLQRVFDEYVQVDASPYRSFGVTGLGLRLSAELVRLMGGDIGAESAPGKGSRFWFTLPLVIAEPATGSAASDAQPVQGGRALIVEADPSSRTRFVEQFDAAGWDVAFVDEIDRVVNELREGAAIGNPYSACVFSHYAVRPVHAEIANRLKADPALAKVALVMITAVGSPGEGKKLWHAGFAAYLRRPVPSDEIREALQVLQGAGPDGRTANLVTRHSLAETRNAQTFAVDGIDRMLASLGTAEGTRRALLIPVSELHGIAELFDQRGMAADSAPSLDHALTLLGENEYECIVVDVRNRADLSTDLAAIRNRLAVRGTIPIVALIDADADTTGFISLGLDEVWTVPVTAGQIELSLSRWQRPAAPESAEATDAPEAAAETEPAVQVTEIVEAAQKATAEVVTETIDQLETTDAQATVDPEPIEAVQVPNLAEATAFPEVAAAVEGLPVEAEPVEAEPVEMAAAGEPEPLQAQSRSWFGGMPLFAAPGRTEAAVVAPEEPVQVEEVEVVAAEDPIIIPTSEAVVEISATDAPSPLEGLMDAEWELHAPIPAVDGFLTTDAEITGPVPDGVVEAVELASPAIEIVAVAAPEPDAVVEPIALESPVAVDPVVAVADLMPTAVGEIDPVIEGPAPAIELAAPVIENATPVIDLGVVAQAAPTMEVVIDAVPAPIELAPVVPLVQLQAEVETTAERVVLLPSEPAEPVIAPVIDLVAPEPEPVAAEPAAEFLLIGNEPPTETWTTPVPAAPAVEVDPSLDAISPALLEQALTGGGFFTQYQIASFLREVPSRIADIATAASRGDAGRANETLAGLRQLTSAVGAARIGAVVDRMIEEITAGRLEGAASGLGAIEHAFLDARQALEQASTHGLPADAPAIGSTFADQLSPSREGAGRALAQKLAASFVADAPKRVADLKLAVAEADGDAVQRVAQTFKGMCGLIGAEWLAKLVALAEADARLKRVTHAERYLDHIDLELGRVLTNLERAQA